MNGEQKVARYLYVIVMLAIFNVIYTAAVYLKVRDVARNQAAILAIARDSAASLLVSSNQAENARISAIEAQQRAILEKLLENANTIASLRDQVAVKVGKKK
jgi:hypothetical protein